MGKKEKTHKGALVPGPVVPGRTRTGNREGGQVCKNNRKKTDESHKDSGELPQSKPEKRGQDWGGLVL